MRTIEIELADEVYQALERLARESETDPPTLIRAQLERLAAQYQSEGLTLGLRKHLSASVDEHRELLQRLAE